MGCPSCSSSVRSMSKVGDRLVSSAWKDTTLSTGLGPAHPTLCIKREPHRVVLLQAATLVSNNNNNSNYTFQLMMSQVCARQILSLQSNLVYRVFQTKGAAQQTDRQTDRQTGRHQQTGRQSSKTDREREQHALSVLEQCCAGLRWPWCLFWMCFHSSCLSRGCRWQATWQASAVGFCRTRQPL